MFIDQVKIYARAGHGGAGCVAFRREAYIAKGGPSGGNGGRGGSVILRADHDLNNLIAQFYTPRLLARDGRPGMGKDKNGTSGNDLIVRVPCGTLAWRIPEPPAPPEKSGTSAESDTLRRSTLKLGASHSPAIKHSQETAAQETDISDEADDLSSLRAGKEEELMTDLTEHGQEFVLCKAGRGGLGNRNFATARRQTPRFAQPGEPGEEGRFRLELRMIAEIGLIGYPNAGKSTLLSAISKARPKIAAYPFTTLHPQIGIVEYKDFQRLTVCDVPGLIEGAHQDVGLGHAFLRHVQRCKVLVLLLDMAGTDGRNPWDDYMKIIDELKLYDPNLATKPLFVVGNKMDEPAAEKNLKTFKRKIRKTPVQPVSAAFGEGIEKFKEMIRAETLR